MKRVVGLAIVLLLWSIPNVFGQAAGVGSIAGVVHDATGARVPGADVTVANESKGFVRNMISNEAGLFSAPALVPGPGYTVTVKLSGFTDFNAKNIELQVGQNISLDVELAVAGAATEVVVINETPVVEQTK